MEAIAINYDLVNKDRSQYCGSFGYFLFGIGLLANAFFCFLSFPFLSCIKVGGGQLYNVVFS